MRLRRDVRRPAERLPVLAELTVPDAPADGPRLSFDGSQIEGVSRIFSGLGIAGEGLVVATAIAGRRPDPRIAVALATTAAVRGASTVIADADLEHRALAPALRLERSPGLAEYMAGDAEAQDLLQVVDVAGAVLGERARLVCVCAGEAPATGDEPDQLAQMPLPAIVDAVSKGTIDGFLLPWEVMPSLKLHEMVKFHSETDPSRPALYSAVFVFAMNQAKYDALPADLKKVIDANSGPQLSQDIGKTWDASQAAGRKLAQDRGNSFYMIPASELQNWVQASQPLYRDYTHALLFDYNVDLNNDLRNLPLRIIRDIVVLPNPGDHELMLGKAYLQLGFRWINLFYSYFVLGQRERIEQGPW